MKNKCEICKGGTCSCTKRHGLKRFATLLLVIGGLNWGLYGVFGFDVVEYVLGYGLLAALVYLLIGLAALYKLGSYCKRCMGKK